jgi:hypothetical protein
MKKILLIVIVLVIVFFYNQPDVFFDLINQPKVKIHLEDFDFSSSFATTGGCVDLRYNVKLINTDKDPVVISALVTEGSLDLLSDTIEVNETIDPNESFTVAVTHSSAICGGSLNLDSKEKLVIKVFVKDLENKNIAWVKKTVHY